METISLEAIRAKTADARGRYHEVRKQREKDAVEAVKEFIVIWWTFNHFALEKAANNAQDEVQLDMNAHEALRAHVHELPDNTSVAKLISEFLYAELPRFAIGVKVYSPICYEIKIAWGANPEAQIYW